MSANLEDFTEDLTEIGKELLSDLIEGGRQDIHEFVLTITRNSTRAMALPADRRQAVLAENYNNLRSLAELNRVRAVNNGWDKIGRVFAILDRILIRIAGAAT